MGVIDGSVARALLLTASLWGASGCAPWGDTVWGPRLPSARTAMVEGEIRSVDSRRGRLEFRTARGRTSTVRVDRATRVVYGRRNYPLDALERGDMVRIWLEVDERGDAWADRVEVRRSAVERYGRYEDERYRGRVERLDGRVLEVSLGNGYFVVDQGYDRVVVHVPRALDRDEYRRLERLRRGDRVRADVRWLSGDEAALVRFR